MAVVAGIWSSVPALAMGTRLSGSPVLYDCHDLARRVIVG
jgi:hypothetical protein